MKTQTSQAQVRLLAGLILGLGTFALYLPVLHHGFVEYDDQQYVTENLRVQAGLTWSNLVWAFGFHASNWHPLTWLSHMLDCQMYGLNPVGHHFTSVLLHVASTLLLFIVWNRMTGTIWRSAAVATVFAWHPLHVESVAWVAERKDMLCAFFWMLTLYAYVSYAVRPRLGCYLTTLGLFALCLMAKPMGVTLPLVLLLLDYWPLGRIAECGVRSAESGDAEVYPARSWKWLLWEKIPFFGLSIGTCALTVMAQQESIVSTKGLPLLQRIPHVLAAYLHYLSAAFVPRHLAVYYPYADAIPEVTVTFACVLLAFITILALRFARQCPWLVVGWFWYLGTLVPVIGLVQVGDQAWADRYTYLPLIGLSVAVVWGAATIIRNRWVLQTMAIAAALFMVTATSIQITYWKDTRSLFEHANNVTHGNYLAITELGSLLAADGKLDEAMQHYRTALQYKPGFPQAYFFMGNVLDQQGKWDEAIAAYQKALWFKPAQEQAHIFLGIVLAKQKKYDEAASHYLAALKLDPDSAVAENNLARVRHTQGRLDEAIEHYTAALMLNPKLALAQNNLGVLLLQKGDLAEGTRRLREAVRLEPDNLEPQYNLALGLNQQQQWREAAELFAKTVGPSSRDPKAHYEFATALAREQKTRDAMSQYAAALLLQPDYPEALNGLAWILATAANSEFRNGNQAVGMSERACDLTGHKNPAQLKTLAAAYAEAGKFPEAIQTAQLAQGLAAATNQKLAEQCGLMLEEFRLSKPWRETQNPP